MVKNWVIKLTACLLLCLVVAGCGVKGEVYEKTPHTESPQGEVPDGLIIVNTYQEVVNELKQIVATATPSAKLAVVDYLGDIDTDLREIIHDITQVDAVGSFAVSSIVYEQAKALGYQQVSFTIQYKRTEAEIKSIITALSASDFENKMAEMFQNFDTGRIIKYAFSGGEEELLQQINKMYYADPSWAMGLKNINLSPLKDSATPQIIEITTEYLWEKDQLIAKRKSIEDKIAQICQPFTQLDWDGKVAAISNYITQNMEIDQDANHVVNETGNTQPKADVYTAFGALIDGKAAQGGIALAAKGMLDYLEMESIVVVGTKQGQSYIWLMVKKGNIWYHYDPTNEGEHILPSVTVAEQYDYNRKIFVVY